jgi:RNA polymerase sigma factor, sigma-70 family
MYPWLLKKTRDEAMAEEIMQDTFLKVWVNRDRLSGMDNPEGYLYRIAANLVLDHFRALALEHKIMYRFQHRKTAAADTDAQGAIDFRETQQLINQAVEQLPDQRKRIYTLRQEGLSYHEIAARLGISSNTVKNQLIAAGKFIRGYLSENGITTLALISFYTTL